MDRLARSRTAIAVTVAAVATAALAVGALGGGDPERRATATTGAGPRLLLTGDGELWEVDVDAERVRHRAMPELVGGDPLHRIVRRGDRFVLWGEHTYVAGPDLVLRPLARGAWYFLPSARPDRVWVVYLDLTSSAQAPRFQAVREVRVDGSVTVPDAEPPPGWPERAAEAGLLLSTRSSDVVVWDPKSRATLNTLEYDRIGDMGPIDGNVLVSCTGSCDHLRFTDVTTGEQRRLEAPPRLVFEPAHGAFSPTGRGLALPVRTRGEQPRRLALVDPALDTVTVVPGSRVPGVYNLVDWSADGADVFLTGGQARDDRVIVRFHRGDARATRLDIRVGPFYGIAAGR